MKSVCVFAGSSSGVTAAYTESARALGRSVAARSLRLFYGGAEVGLLQRPLRILDHADVRS